MIASQFNLDQRLAELLETGTTEYADQPAGSASTSTVSRIGAAIRALFGSASTSRPVRVGAH